MLARLIWWRLLVQRMRRAVSFACDSEGRSMLAKMAMIAITTNNSMRVNAVVGRARGCFIVLGRYRRFY